MKITTKSLSITFLILTGCAHDRTAARRPDDRHNQVVYTGSHIPQPRDRITTSPLSANTPSDSFSRDPNSLVPTEPVVGATDNTGGRGDTGPTPNSH